MVQLCPLDQRLLRPGDFYLLVSPPAAVPPPSRAHSASCRGAVTSSPRLLLCSVSAGSHHVEQQEVSEIALRSLFSMAWLDSVNREREQRGAPRLERCLLSARGDVFRVPWEDLVYPQFVSRPRNSLKEDKESSVKDGEMLINTSHNPCRDNNSSRQDVKLLPSSKTGQSPASSEGEDSEGEYVELTELPLPRFSPQKGSLTQSISLQHRTRTSTHTTAHTPQHTAATTHTPNTTNTHSSWPCVEVSSHTGLCTRLIDANLKPVILVPISPTPSSSSSSSSSAPPVVETSSWMTQEQIEGTDSGRSLKLNTEPANCTEHREEDEVEEGEVEVEEEERGKEGEEERKEVEHKERQKGKHEMVVSVDEGEEKEEEQLEKCRRDEDLLLHTHTAEEGGEREEEEEEKEDASEEGDGELHEEGDDESELGGAEEVEVEEEVQVIIVQQSQDRREEEQVMKEDEREGGEEKEEEERGGEQTHIDEEVGSYTNSHSNDSYSENDTTQTHSEDSYSEKNRQHTQSEGSYSENHTLQTHSEGSYSENNTTQTHSEGSYSENHTLQTHYEGSYSENNKQHTPPGVSTSAVDPDSLWTEPEESENGQEKQEEKEEEEEEEECRCEEVGGGRTAELQTEGTETRFSSSISFPLLLFIPQTIQLFLSSFISSSSSSSSSD